MNSLAGGHASETNEPLAPSQAGSEELMRPTPARFALTLALGFISPVLAQTPPAGLTASDAAFASQKAAFLALPEATRKAAQDALVWLGFYNGVNDGDFGKRTRDAILAFEASVKAPADGLLSPPALKALLTAAQKARDAAKFQVVTDPKSGARIGAPFKLITAGAGIKLEFASSDNADLGALYARLSAPSPTRKVIYKAIKPDAFFVVSGQDGATAFYTRFDKNAAANPPLRGFNFAYPAAEAARLNRIAIAVANSFEPFPVARPGAGRGLRCDAHPRLRSLACACSGACRDRARHRARQSADRAQCRRLPEPDRGRQARADRTRRRRDGARNSDGGFCRDRRSPTLRRAGAGPRHSRFRGRASHGKLGLFCGRRDAARGRGCARQERRRRPGV